MISIKQNSTNAMKKPRLWMTFRQKKLTSLSEILSGKTASPDGILPAFITNLGCKGRRRIAKLATAVSNKGILSKFRREAKVVAITKPIKSGEIIMPGLQLLV